MALVEFLPAAAVRARTAFSQYSQASVSSFSSQFNTDWAGQLGGVYPGNLLASTAQPLQAIFVLPAGNGQLTINCGQPRTPTDGVTTNGSAVVTSATALFNGSDIGAGISGTGIPASTTILSVQSATSATMSANATATASGVSITVSRLGGDWIGIIGGLWQVVPAYLMGRAVADAATTSGSPTVTSATAAFTSRDVGAVIASTNIPVGATVLTVGSATSVTMSANSTATGSSQAITISATNSLYTPDIV